MIGGVATGTTGYFTPVRSQKTGAAGDARLESARTAGATNGDSAGAATDASGLTQEQQQQVTALKRRDAEVRQHEAAHQAAGGSHAGGASFTYQRGPDGKNYAIGGEVQIDVGAASTPEATAAKMDQIKAAALAPAQPSAQDQRVASMADGIKAQAQQEARDQQADGGDQAGEAGRAGETDQTAGEVGQTAFAGSESAAGSESGASGGRSFGAEVSGGQFSGGQSAEGRSTAAGDAAQNVLAFRRAAGAYASAAGIGVGAGGNGGEGGRGGLFAVNA